MCLKLEPYSSQLTSIKLSVISDDDDYNYDYGSGTNLDYLPEQDEKNTSESVISSTIGMSLFCTVYLLKVLKTV